MKSVGKRNVCLRPGQLKGLKVVTPVLTRESWANGKWVNFLRLPREWRLQGKLPPYNLERMVRLDTESVSTKPEPLEP